MQRLHYPFQGSFLRYFLRAWVFFFLLGMTAGAKEDSSTADPQQLLEAVETYVDRAYSNLGKNHIGESRLDVLTASLYRKKFKKLGWSSTTRKQRWEARGFWLKIRKARRAISRKERALVKEAFAVLKEQGPRNALDFRKNVIAPAEISYREYARIDRAIIRAMYRNRGQEPDRNPDARNSKSRRLPPGLNPGSTVLTKVKFQSGSAELKPGARTQLERFARILVEYPQVHAEIHGYTDNVGNAELNRNLSYKRARSVVSYLIKKGVKRSRLRAVGMGEKNPIAGNDTPQGRAKNRRVELIILD
ncbi:MAG: OmpA family protein [Chitinivibrionales bacterium]|nr:OmpA family protein [Chitinivibrionales bacterium]